MHSQNSPILIGKNASRLTNNFIDQRLKLTDIDDLARFVSLHHADGVECLPLFAALASKPVGAFEGLATLYATVHGGDGKAGKPSSKCIRVVRDLLLSSVDRRLQTIYRNHFSTHPLNIGVTHEQKIDTLEGTRDQVLSVLDSYDWRWLADWLDIGRIGETAENCVQYLANFAFPIKRVNFRFTYHCNIACRHCYNSSGPYQKAKRIAREAMLTIIDQMPEAGLRHLNLTGGEPFLYLNDLVALIAAGRAAGLSGISIYTNGFWARSHEQANQTLARLAQAGFTQGRDDYVKVSAGVYHQEFIAFDRILILARAYHGRFGKRLPIDFELASDAQSMAIDVRDRINSAGLTDKVTLQFRTVASLGRAMTIAGIPVKSIDRPCDGINQIVFDPDGSVRPCCGFNNENYGVVIGKADRHSLKNLAKRMQNDPILQFLSTHPMSEIFSYVSTVAKNEGYSSRCELCQDALGGMTDKEPLQSELFDRQRFYPFWYTLSSAHQKVR